MTPIKGIMAKVKSTLNLTDYIDTTLAEKSIRSNIYFRGPNAWILVIAMVIASIGLNVNSIPVIIGAMLISPLMGPIFGVGLGLGTNDFELVKASVKNLLVMVSISLIASLLKDTRKATKQGDENIINRRIGAGKQFARVAQVERSEQEVEQ